MLIPWSARRQIVILFFIFLLLALVVFWGWKTLNKPTCFDNKQNQDESGVDCGGSCAECLGDVKDLVVVWSKFFKLNNGMYEMASLIENPNLFLSIPLLKYTAKLYDADNVLISVVDGETKLSPGERYIILNSNINTGHRLPKEAFIELEKNPKWKRTGSEEAMLVVSKKTFVNNPFPRLSAQVDNKDFFSADNISAVVALYNKEGNVIGVSSTVVNSIPGNSSRAIFFTWPNQFAEEPVSSEIILRAQSSK